jgi:hypothetical protein
MLIPDPTAIFTQAQTAWSARAIPAYESFTLPCSSTLLADRCSADTQVQFIVRLSDGRYFAQTIAADGRPATVLVHGGDIVGPAGAPFGFYRRAPVPGATAAAPSNLAKDPIATIATVTAMDRAYEITLTGTDQIGAYSCYHLRLRPLRDPQNYLLRDLWVDTTTYEVVRLNYAWPFNGTTADITYDFAPVGPQATWTIVHIQAQAVSHGLFTTHVDRVDENLQNIAFPASEPDADFTP